MKTADQALTGRRDFSRHYLGSRNLGSFRGARSRGPAGFVWHRHGNFIRSQVPPRLFSFFRVRRSAAINYMSD